LLFQRWSILPPSLQSSVKGFMKGRLVRHYKGFMKGRLVRHLYGCFRFANDEEC
jgi:hypothetical protein